MKFLEAMEFAHACKVFDEARKIPKEQLDQILEAGRLTPSSFGLEHTRLLVVQSQKLKEELQPLCWNQKQIPTCSELVIFKSKVKDIIAPSKYILDYMQRRGLDERFMDRLKSFQEKSFQTRRELEDWSMKQAYLMASSMVNCAAYLGIDSCCIEGFMREEVEGALGIEPQEERIALLVAFGYRVNEPAPKFRIKKEQFVEIR
ncbi:NAD(P)H-dependent oxidoreductase [Helicobacter kayseriensis]|uniref:NAD(P)H-dependent oxidoreductase n=1 Tax=Helicobacter kayseriensis TaxID=2905877 RepID=UPI001E3FFA7E|nr:NAD(P)H-dependent oxidoreductase [Helicobacter kayseriensis]MCE3047069.1 NAD(P)H-dependent oxidoreductase [Helicobacter kayseriensis]MCE3048271.1 NAD(P)H-dependent oxidoreductase [Helicobacter kayseriensis]